MAKLFYMQFYPLDYQADVRCLPMSTQGAWMQILCVLWRSPQQGKRTLTIEEWSRELGCSSSELSLYLTQLEYHKVGKISRELIENVEQITISSKRIKREKMKQSLVLKRKQKQRDTSMSRACHANVTDLSQRCHAEELELELELELKLKEKKEKRVAPLRASDDLEWLVELKKNPAYCHIDFERENGKMDAWLALPSNKNRMKTRKFILNWLGKIEKPVTVLGAQAAACQERVQRGQFLNQCGEPSVVLIGGQPRCQTHKEAYESRISRTAT